jgi:hypothetical protein
MTTDSKVETRFSEKIMLKKKIIARNPVETEFRALRRGFEAALTERDADTLLFAPDDEARAL